MTVGKLFVIIVGVFIALFALSVWQQSSYVSVDLSGSDSSKNYPIYKEIVKPSGYVNSDEFTIGEFVGEKVILLDIMTYSCINCQRTFPYINAWHEKYKNQGLQIIGIHTPEFEFEKDIENVREAAERFGLEFPIVLDNDYGTWRAYNNSYWPRKYLIDIEGRVVYDHIGEGKYDETEKKIQELLKDRASKLDKGMKISEDVVEPEDAEDVDLYKKRSHETYFGSLRNKNQGVVTQKDGDIWTFVRPEKIKEGQLYLVGDWKITGEYAEAISDSASIIYNYSAQKVFLVMSAEKEVSARVFQDGKMVDGDAGQHIEEGFLKVQNEQLYRIIESEESGNHLLEIKIDEPGLRAFAFTFG